MIQVTFTSTRRGKEKTSSVGLITVKTTRVPIRPNCIKSVRNTSTGADVSVQEAVRLGILDDKQQMYTDKRTGRRMLVAEAAEAGMIKIEYTGDVPQPETISKIYAVRAVVDRRQKKTVTFHEAVQRRIIDRETGSFRDTLTGEQMYVGDAIMRGFLKARIIEDDSGLDIDPENKMVIEKTDTIRKRLLKPLGVISAFKQAAASANK